VGIIEDTYSVVILCDMHAYNIM